MNWCRECSLISFVEKPCKQYNFSSSLYTSCSLFLCDRNKLYIVSVTEKLPVGIRFLCQQQIFEICWEARDTYLQASGKKTATIRLSVSQPCLKAESLITDAKRIQKRHRVKILAFKSCLNCDSAIEVCPHEQKTHSCAVISLLSSSEAGMS